MDGTDLAIRSLIQRIAAKRGMSVAEATAGVLWALEQLLLGDMKPEDAPRKELGDEGPISAFIN